jgi:short-chain fatty acids transporter
LLHIFQNEYISTMTFSDRFINVVKAVLPAPFTIAVLLTVFTWCLAFFFGNYEGELEQRFLAVATSWESGLWNNSLLVFAMQMMLMLVLGHVLALSKPIDNLIQKALFYCKDTASSAATVVFLTMLVGLFNWGLGLIFGAIFARKVGEKFSKLNLPLNYPLIGAAGYAGLMVWHGGLSGSSLTKVAEAGHLKTLVADFNSELASTLPSQITFAETVFSPMNSVVSIMLLSIIPLVMYRIGKYSNESVPNLKSDISAETSFSTSGAELLDYSKWVGLGFGFIVLMVALLKLFVQNNGELLSFFTPNNINLVLLSLGLLFHQSFSAFLKALEAAIGGVSGILIQFPLYFGIMGMMKASGLVDAFSQGMVSISNETTYPIFTFISAGIVNIFVPSGGGQWAIQGPIIVQAASELGVSLSKSIMALAYGDQLTNMLQPFWALPLLGITGLKAREILPYTLVLFVLGCTIFCAGLLLF